MKLEEEILKCYRSGLLVIDMSGTVIYRNEIAKRILGDNLIDIGDNLRSSSAGNAFQRALLESMEREYLPARTETTLPGKKGGMRRTIGFTLSELKDSGSNRVGICVFFKDLTYIGLTEESRDLDERLRLLGEMAAGLAQEIRNPITSISAHCGLLRMRCLEDDEQILSVLAHIESEIGKMEAIIRDCLNFVRPTILNLDVVPIKPLIERLLADASKIYPTVNFSLLMNDANIHAKIDEILFEQALRSIIANSAQICPDGKVVVSARLSKGFWDLDPDENEPALHAGAGDMDYFLLISIKCNAVGILENNREKYFVPYFNAKKSGTELSLAQKIISAHKGVLDIISEPDKGAEFIIRISLGSKYPEF
ncbi:MAG: hypothetical protein FWH25_01680 [Syntrophorhabdaceae bacterium]|nr:hypothetical protein [Syntrophorhabdaceae bacterium]